MLSFALAIPASAQNTQNTQKPRWVESESVVNDKALYLAKPDYPDEAIEKGLGGPVTVKVWIDASTGDVIEAMAISGNGLLLEPSEAAALKSRFDVKKMARAKFAKKPSDGDKPEHYTGAIVYNFSPARARKKDNSPIL